MSIDDDLWGELPDPAAIQIPEDIIRRQADLLSEKTHGTHVGEVRRVDSSGSSDYGGYGNDRHSDQRVEWALEIRVPRMDNYVYQLLTATHDIIRLYPVRVISSHIESGEHECDSTEKFKKALREIFRSEETQRVLQSLRAHATDPRSRLRELREQQRRGEAAPPPVSGPDDDIPF
jgi:hypothetical protein